MSKTLKAEPKFFVGEIISACGEIMEIISIEKHRIGDPLETVYMYTGRKLISGENKMILEKEIKSF